MILTFFVMKFSERQKILFVIMNYRAASYGVSFVIPDLIRYPV